jgi:hypothetical protein
MCIPCQYYLAHLRVILLEVGGGGVGVELRIPGKSFTLRDVTGVGYSDMAELCRARILYIRSANLHC